PELPQRPGQAEGELRLLPFARPSQRLTEVVVVLRQPHRGHALLAPPETRFLHLGEQNTVLRVPASNRFRLACGLEGLGAELADDVEHPKARTGRRLPDGDEAVIDQARQAHEHAAVRDDELRRFARPTSREHGELTKGALIVTRQKVIAPRNHIADAPLAFGGVPRTARENVQGVLERLTKAGEREMTDPGRGQLDRERDAVEPPSDLRDVALRVGAAAGEAGANAPR